MQPKLPPNYINVILGVGRCLTKKQRQENKNELS